jgi:hypothetical protein
MTEPEQPKIWVRVVEAHAIRTWVALILAASAGISLIALVVGAVWNTIANPEVTDLSANFMTVISGSLGVIFGGLAGFLGGKAFEENKGGPPDKLDTTMGIGIDDRSKPPGDHPPP